MASSTSSDLKLELITDELEIPWGMDFLDNGDISALTYATVFVIAVPQIIGTSSFFLTAYSEERNICKYSDLWIYLLFSLILNLILLKKVLKYNELNITIMKKLCKMIIFKFVFKTCSRL